MSAQTPTSLEGLIQALRCLPGVGPKSAQRMAYHLLQRDPKGARTLAGALNQALERIHHCEKCNNFSETPVCEMCSNTRRDAATLCVVEMPADLLTIEQTQCYQGFYFVLMGRLSPLDGVGPREIHLDRLSRRVQDGLVSEVVIATSFTAEGEATAHYISQALSPLGVRISRIARGVPVGGELEHVDSGTVAQALLERRAV